MTNLKDSSTEEKIKHVTFGLIFSWFFSIFVGFPAVIILFSKPMTGIILLTVALIAFPPTNKFLVNKLNISLSRGLKVFIIIILFSIAGNMITKNSQPTDSATVKLEPAKNETAQQSEKFKIGNKVKIGNSILTINKVEFSQGGQYTKPQEGNEWVNLNITIENTGSSQQYVTTLGQMFVRDSEKNSYQVAVTNKIMENPGFGLDGTIIANSKRTGWVGFEINKGSTGLHFQYNGSMFGGKSVLIELPR